MLVIQQNCGKGYECTISAFEAGLSLEAEIVCIQEPFLGNRHVSHSGFNLYWSSGTDNRKNMRVLTAVRKDILNRVLIENRTDLVSHPYCLVLDIKELHPRSGKALRKTRVVNLYNNKVSRGQLWERSSPTVRRAMEDISWRQVIRGRVLILGDMNAHSTMWNPHCLQKQNAGPLENLIEKYELIVNNDTDFPTRPSSRGFSIIDLALTNSELGLLRVWEIPEEYPSLSDHELIIMEWEDIKIQDNGKKQATMSGWSIQKLLEDEKLLQIAKEEWEKASIGQPQMRFMSTKEDLDKEVVYFERKLVSLLNNHAKITRITAYSKRWWNEEVAEARKEWARNKRKLSGDKLKLARNSYYRTIKKAKRLCWQKFLQGDEQQDHCWTAIKYTKPLQLRTTPALKDSEGNVATSMKAKEALVRKSAFPKPPSDSHPDPEIEPGSAHLAITENIVYHALFSQSATKAPEPNKINFQILRLIWSWDKVQITRLVQHSIRLGYHPKEWKKARGVLLEKAGKRDFSLVRSYRVISLLNCMGKVIEKVVAVQLSQYCENYSKLHPGQMGGRKERSAIDVVAILVHAVQKGWEDKKLVAALFMDVKGAFDHVSKRQLISCMVELGADGDLVLWTKSFLTDRKVQLIIDGYENREREIETGIPQGSPVSPILFLIYISGVFDQVTETCPLVTSLSFIDDLGFIASGSSVKEVGKALEKVAKTVIEWGVRNAVTYDTSKTEAVLFSRARRQRLGKQLLETKIKVGSKKISFNKKATRWLGIWLDSQLKFSSHIHERIKKARIAEIQVKGLTQTYGLVPALVRRIQLSVIQSTALYGSELWWKGQKNHEHTIQQLFNRQARAITEMYRSTPLHPLLSEAGIVPASTHLDYRQRLYAHRLLSLPDRHPAKDILPASLREGDEGLQPGEPPKDSLMWTQNARPTSYGQWLAWQVTFDHSVDPASGVEPVEVIKTGTCFEGKIIIENKKQALDEATKHL